MNGRRFGPLAMVLFLLVFAPGCATTEAPEPEAFRQIFVLEPSSGHATLEDGAPVLIESREDLKRFLDGPGLGMESGLQEAIEQERVDLRREAIVVIPHREPYVSIAATMTAELEQSRLTIEVVGDPPPEGAVLLPAVGDYTYVLAVSKSLVHEVVVQRHSGPEQSALPTVTLLLTD